MCSGKCCPKGTMHCNACYNNHCKDSFKTDGLTHKWLKVVDGPYIREYIDEVQKSALDEAIKAKAKDLVVQWNAGNI